MALKLKKLAIIIFILNITPFVSKAQLKHLFTKKTNSYLQTDLSGNPITDTKFEVNQFDIYFDKQNDTGYILYTFGNNRKIKVPLKEMYTGMAKGITIYYFQSSDNKYKFSVSAEEEGLAEVNYSTKILTIYLNTN